jgi:DNA invertase Pin-like site-specific DNA recombinase
MGLPYLREVDVALVASVYSYLQARGIFKSTTGDEPMTTLFAYGRASTDKQQITLKTQEEILTNYYRLRHSIDSSIRWGGWYPDAAITSRVPFLERPMGSKIFRVAEPGDLMVVSNFDRAFRSVMDCDGCLKSCLEKRIRVIILDLDVNTETALGRAFVKLVAVLKELERDEISRRTKEAIQHNIRNVRPHGTGIPPGWARTHDKSGKKFMPCFRERQIGKQVVELYHQGKSSRAIAKQITLEQTQRNDRRYDYNQVPRLYSAALIGFPKLFPSDIPLPTKMWKYMALYDGQVPQILPGQVSSGLLYTLPPMKGPPLYDVPRAFYIHLLPEAYEDRKQEQIRVAQDRQKSNASSCILPSHHQPLTPTLQDQ